MQQTTLFEQMTNAFPQTGLDHTLPLAIGEGSHTTMSRVRMSMETLPIQKVRLSP
jgi:hypothetical protein